MFIEQMLFGEILLGLWDGVPVRYPYRCVEVHPKPIPSRRAWLVRLRLGPLALLFCYRSKEVQVGLCEPEGWRGSVAFFFFFFLLEYYIIIRWFCGVAVISIIRCTNLKWSEVTIYMKICSECCISLNSFKMIIFLKLGILTSGLTSDGGESVDGDRSWFPSF